MFSKATEYALRATIYLAQKSSEENKVSIDEVAEAIGSPRSFTAKILQILRKNNRIIHSVPGPNGGFYMTQNNRDLPVRAVLTVMNEDDVLSKCVLGLNKCSELKPCPMHEQYKVIKVLLIDLFESKTIQQLSDQTDKENTYIKVQRKK